MTLAQVTRSRTLVKTSRGLSSCRASESIRRGHISPFHATRPPYPSDFVPKIRRCGALDHDRTFVTSTISSVLLPPAVFLGLLGTLWFYKCCMMVLFQSKIIYMPSIPPFSRREEIESYRAGCRPVVWKEKRINSEDGTELTLCIGEIPTSASNDSPAKTVTLLYFQGLVFPLSIGLI